MKQKQNDISRGCKEYRPQIQRLVELGADDPERILWERHSADCPECSKVLSDEMNLREDFASLEDPGPAYISSRVLSRIKRAEVQPIRIRIRDIGLGLAGTLAGVVLGVVIAGSNVKSVQADPLSGYDVYFQQMDSGLEDLTLEVLDNSTQEES